MSSKDSNGDDGSSSKSDYDIILMDIEMPIMNGLVATRIIREREKQSGSQRPIPIVALSGNARQVLIDEALASGMQYFIVKPYNKQVGRMMMTLVC